MRNKGLIDDKEFRRIEHFDEFSNLFYWSSRCTKMTSMIVGSEFEGEAGDQVQFILPDGHEFAPAVELTTVLPIELVQHSEHNKIIVTTGLGLATEYEADQWEALATDFGCDTVDKLLNQFKDNCKRHIITWSSTK